MRGPSPHLSVDRVRIFAWTKSAFWCGSVNHATSPKLYRSYYPHRSRELVSPVCGIFFFKFVHVLLTEDKLNKRTRERMNTRVVTDPFHHNNHKSCCESFKSTEYLYLNHVTYEACEQFYSKLIHARVALIDLEHFMQAVSIFFAYNNNRAHIDIME